MDAASCCRVSFLPLCTPPRGRLLYRRILSHGLPRRVFPPSQVFSAQRCRFPLRRVAAPALLPRRFCTEPGEPAAPAVSKRRSRGPVMAAKKAAEGTKQEDGKYKHTVDLPKTTFGLRANSVVREPELQKLWEENQVLKRVSERNTGATFVLHDGPPYANGDLHMGHALNKILKDIINRYKLLQNHKVSFVPGWDCHGLPIELKGKFILYKDLFKRSHLSKIIWF
ncbi:hypothetical protein ACP4OV_000381 [Aristida adscensionis]